MKLNKSVYTRLIIFFIVIVVLLGVVLFWWQDGISAVNPEDKKAVTFTITQGESVKQISSRLSQENLIRSPSAFFLLVKFLGLERQLQAGEYRLSRAMDAKTIGKELTHGITDVWITTLEGWRVEEIAALLNKEIDIPESEFMKVAKEGYMFPDTYLVSHESSAAGIATLFENTFYKKVTPVMIEDAKKTGLTFHQVVILASIIEREGKNSDDKPIISGILYNRLNAKHPLQVDATLQYALGYQTREKTWWKKELYEEDKKIDSVYNTYKNVGLPPEPISNPGLDSIKAAIYPKQSEYFYYLHDIQGRVHYAKTLEEHTQNIGKYL